MAKRKRGHDDTLVQEPGINLSERDGNLQPPASKLPLYVQIVTGSYEKALHGITAAIPQTLLQTRPTSEEIPSQPAVSFADSFLFNAHASSIRSLALSPTPTDGSSPPQKLILATGSTDERINLYHLSLRPPAAPSNDASAAPAALPSLTGTKAAPDPRNRELGALLHHAGAVTALHFPSRGKLLSAAADNTIAVSRTRDWTVLSTIKVPVPKPVGRPSGDTLAPGEVPAGVNAFAVHPSGKLLVSVGRGERCMRLWNLMTGKKAGVLSFDREMLAQVGEGRHGTGEGRKVVWDPAGEEFAVGFERGVVVFGMDCKPRGIIMPQPRTKVHQMRYAPDAEKDVLCVSTEDGRILFYATGDTTDADETADELPMNGEAIVRTKRIRRCRLLGEIGGLDVGFASRVKDFEILTLPPRQTPDAHDPGNGSSSMLIVAGCSDGAVRLWLIDLNALLKRPAQARQKTSPPLENGEEAAIDHEEAKKRQPGTLLGTYETGNRITCLVAFVMVGEPQENEDDEGAANGHDHMTSSSDEDDE